MQQKRIERRLQKRLEVLRERIRDDRKLRARLVRLLAVVKEQEALIEKYKDHNPMMTKRATAKLINTLKNMADKLFLLKLGVRLWDEDLGPADEPPEMWNRPDPRWERQS